MITEKKTQKKILEPTNLLAQKIKNGELLKVEKILEENIFFADCYIKNFSQIIEKIQSFKDKVTVSSNYEIFVPLEKINNEWYVEKDRAILVKTAMILAMLDEIEERKNSILLKRNKINCLMDLLENTKKDKIIVGVDDISSNFAFLLLDTKKVAITWALRDYYISHTDDFSKIIEKNVFNKFVYFIFDKTYKLVIEGTLNEHIIRNEEAIRIMTKKKNFI